MGWYAVQMPETPLILKAWRIVGCNILPATFLGWGYDDVMVDSNT